MLSALAVQNFGESQPVGGSCRCLPSGYYLGTTPRTKSASGIPIHLSFAYFAHPFVAERLLPQFAIFLVVARERGSTRVK